MNKKTKERFMKILIKNTTQKGRRFPQFINDTNVLKSVEEFLDSEKENLVNSPIYTPQQGHDVVAFLQQNGFTARLIGSLSRGQNSNTDIDIHIQDKNERTEELLTKLLKPNYKIGEIVRTDWGGLYFYDTTFGDIDVFFKTDDFNF